MTSKAVALATLTNTGGKRKADNADDAATKKPKWPKLKSHHRTLSAEDAAVLLAGSEARIRTKNKIIGDRRKEIRELNEKVELRCRLVSRIRRLALALAFICADALLLQLATANRSLTLATNAVAKIRKDNVLAEQMVQRDADLILEKITNLSSYCGRGEAVGYDAMDDMIALGNDGDVLCLCSGLTTAMSARTLCVGAIRCVTAANGNIPPPTLSKSVQLLCLKLLDETITNAKTLSLVASAMNIGANGMDADICENAYGLLCRSVFAAAEQMKKHDPLQYGSYNASRDGCPIIEILAPTYHAIRHEGGSTAKALIFEAMKQDLLASVNEIPTTPSYAMPAEAAIVGKRCFPEVQRFLLSPTDTVLRLNFSKAGRMDVHRLIDNSMGCKKLRHSSEGGGRSRCLVLTKADAAPPAMLHKRKERQERHLEMLVECKVCHVCAVTLPRPNTRLGLTLAPSAVWNMPELKGVAPDSPVLDQIPAQLRQGVCIVALKAEAIGRVLPRTARECAMAIGKVSAGRAPLVPGTLDLFLIPLPCTGEV